MNAWDYSIYLPLKSHTVELVTEVVGCATRAGYSTVNPYTGKIDGISVDGMNSLEFNTEDAALTYMSNEYGLLNLWKGDERDISVSFNPRKDVPLIDVSVFVENVFFRDDTPERLVIAKEIYWIYVDLCSSLAPIYGYTADENFGDFFWPRIMEMPSVIAKRQKPPILFWLNYFSNEYIELIGVKTIQKFGGKIHQLPHGALVLFVDYPWEVDSDLYNLNVIWEKSNQ